MTSPISITAPSAGPVPGSCRTAAYPAWSASSSAVSRSWAIPASSTAINARSEATLTPDETTTLTCSASGCGRCYASGSTVEKVGLRLECSATKISRLETGVRRASLRDVRDLCGIYGIADEARLNELVNLAGRAREPGWWSQYDEPVLSPYIGLEQEAIAITAYSMYYVPALLQSGDYARATIRSIERKMAGSAG